MDKTTDIAAPIAVTVAQVGSSMKRWLAILLLAPLPALGQDFEISYAGSHAPEPEVLALVKAYTPHLLGWTTVEDRDRQRGPMVVPGYFYHDMDGTYIGFDGLTERHARNDLTIIEREFFDAVLHQYENTAILTYKAWTQGTDKGKPFEGYGSAALVMTRTSDGWRAVADIVGQEPAPPATPMAPN